MTAQSQLYLGIDLGSTTVKYALLDVTGKLLAHNYVRHQSAVVDTLLCELQSLFSQIETGSLCTVDGHKPIILKLNFTGSAALDLSQALQAPFVQEVIAASTFLSHNPTPIDVAIELGGEDGKIIFLSNGVELRMNEACAGGTGAFADQMATLLGVNTPDLNTLAAQASKVHPIASRCGVFAKTDVVALLNQGVPKSEIAKSVFAAICEQTISGLTCGRPITGNVCFLGGPLSFLTELRQCFVDKLQSEQVDFVNLEHSEYAIAIGAAQALLQEDTVAQNSHDAIELGELISKLKNCRLQTKAPTLAPLFPDLLNNAAGPEDTLSIVVREDGASNAFAGSDESYEQFKARHALACVETLDLDQACGPLFLGIDLGSTTIKLVLLNAQQQMLASFYAPNGGAPLKFLLPKVQELLAAIPSTAYLAEICTTGYGADLAKAALNARHSEVETLAHQRAAVAFDPLVSYVIDIGGQDMKCIQVNSGLITSIKLNEACSSGCGSFLETFASQLNLPLAEFIEQALHAAAPCDLGTRCTVFMNSKVKQAQRDNLPISDIAAGLCLSIVRNALYKVLKIHDSSELGEHVVVQGGTFLNDAILRAFELNIGRNVTRPNIAGLMGAFGAALLAQERCTSPEQAMHFGPELFDLSQIKTRDFRCKGCTNHCALTVNTFLSGQKHLQGNRCDFALNNAHKTKTTDSNFCDFKNSLLFERPVYPAQGIAFNQDVTPSSHQSKSDKSELAAKAAKAAALLRQAKATGKAHSSARTLNAAQEISSISLTEPKAALSVTKTAITQASAKQAQATSVAVAVEAVCSVETTRSVDTTGSAETVCAVESLGSTGDAITAKRVETALTKGTVGIVGTKNNPDSARTLASAQATRATKNQGTARTFGAERTLVAAGTTGSSATAKAKQGNALYLPVTEGLNLRGNIGIPRVLNMFEHYPFWHALFTELKFSVCLSPQSDSNILSLGNQTIPSQSLCLPAKLAHGHITYLANHSVNRIFLPCVPREDKSNYFCENDEHFACPVVGGYPEALKLNLTSAFPELKLFTPFLMLNKPKLIINAIQEIDSSISAHEISQAIEVAQKAQNKFKDKLVAHASNQIAKAEQESNSLIVLSGHPYHIDPFINHGIPALLASMGTSIVTEDAVAPLALNRPQLEVVNQWAFHSRLYRAAQFVLEHPQSELVHLVSFGCGLDAITSEQVKNILQSHNRLYTMLKIDEGDTLGAAKIRLRSLLCATKDARAAAHAAQSKTNQGLLESKNGEASSAEACTTNNAKLQALTDASSMVNASIATLRLGTPSTCTRNGVDSTINEDTTDGMATHPLDCSQSNLGHDRILNSLKLHQAAVQNYQETACQTQTTRNSMAKSLEGRTIYMPQMAPVHFPILASSLQSLGYNVRLLENVTEHDIEQGLKLINNDACYPAIVAIGQLLSPVINNEIDEKSSALLLAQTCGSCRATNYTALLEWALQELKSDIPIVTLQGSALNDSHLHMKLGLKGLKSLILALLYGDLLQHLYLHTKTYELKQGSADSLLQRYHQQLNADFFSKRHSFKQQCQHIINDFAAIELRTEKRPKVGIVGEILLKYHPVANNHIVEHIIAEGGEPVLGDITSFVLYCLHGNVYQAQTFGIDKLKGVFTWFIVKHFDHLRNIVLKLLQNSPFADMPSFKDLLEYGQRFTTWGQQAGEGWLLEAEMLDFIEHGVPNVVCVQPFACLPNHITGKGIMRTIRENYPQANLCSLDFEAGTTQSNIVNRLKLFMSQAKQNLSCKVTAFDKAMTVDKTMALDKVKTLGDTPTAGNTTTFNQDSDRIKTSGFDVGAANAFVVADLKNTMPNLALPKIKFKFNPQTEPLLTPETSTAIDRTRVPTHSPKENAEEQYVVFSTNSSAQSSETLKEPAFVQNLPKAATNPAQIAATAAHAVNLAANAAVNVASHAADTVVDMAADVAAHAKAATANAMEAAKTASNTVVHAASYASDAAKNVSNNVIQATATKHTSSLMTETSSQAAIATSQKTQS